MRRDSRTGVFNSAPPKMEMHRTPAIWDFLAVHCCHGTV
jgi:hypothetical protein